MDIRSLIKEELLAQKAYAVLATSESALYANIILSKGVVKE